MPRSLVDLITSLDITDRVARALGKVGIQVAGADVAAGNAVHVKPGTGALFDVSDRAARLLGVVTGAAGAALATQATLDALLTAISDGTLRGTTQEKTWTVASGATLATAGQALVTGACVVRGIWAFNATGASVIMYLADRTSTISNGVVPAGSGGGLGCTNTLVTAGGASCVPNGLNVEGGLAFQNGVWIQPSSTISSMTSQGSTAVYWVIEYRTGTGL